MPLLRPALSDSVPLNASLLLISCNTIEREGVLLYRHLCIKVSEHIKCNSAPHFPYMLYLSAILYMSFFFPNRFSMCSII